MNDRSLKIFVQTVLLLLFMIGASPVAFSAPVEVQSIRILPTRVTVGKYPNITATIAAKKIEGRGTTVEVTVIASVVWPDHVMRSWTWKEIRMSSGEIRSFSIPQVFKIKSAGTYKVDFSVYSKTMDPLHRLSQTFIAEDPSHPDADKNSSKKSGTDRQSPPHQKKTDHPAEDPLVGIGVYVNTLNPSGGVTMLLWPFKYVGLQGIYTDGMFSIAEGRLLARYPLSSGINPYMGVGYVNVATERSVEFINIKTQFRDTGVSAVIGAEIPVSERVFGYVEICGTSIVLKKDVASAGVTGTADVTFAPVSIGIGIVYFLF